MQEEHLQENKVQEKPERGGRKAPKAILKVAYMGMFLALAMIVSYVEILIPVLPAVPGVKIGLANAFILIILYHMGVKEAWIVNILRVVLTALLFTNFYALSYSLAGAVLSLLVMTLLYRKEKVFSSIGVGMLGGVAHNVGQLLVALVITNAKAILAYTPFLLVAGLVCGALTGGITKLLSPIIRKFINSSKHE